MVLPKHAYEAYMRLNIMERDFASFKALTSQYFKLEKAYSVSKGLDIKTYIEMLLTVTASLDGEINSEKISAIRFVTGSNEWYHTATQKDFDFVRSYPPALLYDAFTYQNEIKEVVLPELLSHIEILVRFVGQLSSGNAANDLYLGLIALYQKSLEKRYIVNRTMPIESE